MKGILFLLGGLGIALALTSATNGGTALTPDNAKRAAIDALIRAANNAGADMFEGLTRQEVYNVWSKASLSEIETMSRLFAKGEKNWTDNDKWEFKAIWKKVTGRSIQ